MSVSTSLRFFTFSKNSLVPNKDSAAYKKLNLTKILEYVGLFMSENLAFTRLGSPQVMAKIDDIFTVQITLNGSPDSMWVDCYRHPTDYTDNESHPSRTIVKGNKILFFSVESELEKNVLMIDDYLKQANDCFVKKISEELLLQNKEALQSKMKQDELTRVNKNIKGF